MSEQQHSPGTRPDAANSAPGDLASDLMCGVEAIASYMGLTPRQVYHQQKRIPIFKIGAMLCARRSAILAWIKDQEDSRRSA